MTRPVDTFHITRAELKQAVATAVERTADLAPSEVRALMQAATTAPYVWTGAYFGRYVDEDWSAYPGCRCPAATAGLVTEEMVDATRGVRLPHRFDNFATNFDNYIARTYDIARETVLVVV